MAGDAVVAQIGGEDVRRGGPERVVLVEAVLAVGLRQVFLQLLLGVAPREVAVRLRETGVTQRAHHRRAGERLGQEQRLGVLARHGGDHILPEAHRLGMRIVHAENRHAGLDPQIHDAFDFLLDALHVGVEVDRIDVLVFLRRILGERDRAVRLRAEPVRMLLHPRMVGGALQCEVERDLQAELVRALAEHLEIVHRAEQRVDGVVPAEFGSDAEWRAGVVRSRDQRVVAALAVGHADGEDRRQIDDVESFGGRALQAGKRCLEIAGDDLALVVVVGALRTREELVPCGEARLRTLHAETLRVRFAQSVAQRMLLVQMLDLVGGGRRKAVFRSQRFVGHRLRGLAQDLLVVGGQLGIVRAGPACEQLGAGFQRVLHVVVHLDLDGGVMQP